jgi:hypothetical protein
MFFAPAINYKSLSGGSLSIPELKYHLEAINQVCHQLMSLSRINVFAIISAEIAAK